VGTELHRDDKVVVRESSSSPIPFVWEQQTRLFTESGCLFEVVPRCGALFDGLDENPKHSVLIYVDGFIVAFKGILL